MYTYIILLQIEFLKKYLRHYFYFLFFIKWKLNQNFHSLQYILLLYFTCNKYVQQTLKHEKQGNITLRKKFY